MSGLDNLKYLIEALRGGDKENAPKGVAAQMSERSTYNPQGVPVAPGQSLGLPIGGHASVGGAPNDPEYNKYLQTNPDNPLPYMEWLERGG